MAMDSSLCVESMVLMMPQNFCMKNFNLLLCSSIFSATSIATLEMIMKVQYSSGAEIILEIFWLLISVGIMTNNLMTRSVLLVVLTCQSGCLHVSCACVAKPWGVYLFEESFKCIVTCLLHLSVDVSTELGHDLKQSSVVVHKAAAELGRMSGQ